MAQFDAHENLNLETQQLVPYLLNVQADLLDGLRTRMVVPLLTLSGVGSPIGHLNPQFKIKRISVVMATAEMAGVDLHILGEKVCSLQDRRNDIIAALDFLFSGY